MSAKQGVREMTKRVAIYARVSTNQQTVQNQLDALREVASRSGYSIVEEFVDEGISGAKGRTDRPALDRMLKDCAKRRFDMVMVWDISRLGRSLQNLIEVMNELQSMRVDLFFVQQGMDTSTASGRMMFSVFGALGEYERELIRERTLLGQQRARAQGVKFGRPKTVTDNTREAIRLMRSQGVAIRKIATTLGIGVSTCYAAMA
jgi:DNA invertase Pin-like site-specific DNA recombinase